MRAHILFASAFFFIGMVASAPFVVFGQVSSASVHEPQRNTADDLTRLLTDAISAAKSGDIEYVDQFVESVRIPNFEAWFADTLYHSESWAEAYRNETSYSTFGVALKCSLHEMARRTGKIIVREMSEGEIGAPKKPIHVLQATWQDEGAPASAEPQWRELFVWIDGGFRWYSIRSRETVFPLPTGFRPVRVAAPKYPYPADGLHPGGTVRLTFVIRKDGTVEDVHPNRSITSSTDPNLVRAAVEVVKQFRFIPISKSEGEKTKVDDIGVLVRPMEIYTKKPEN